MRDVTEILSASEQGGPQASVSREIGTGGHQVRGKAQGVRVLAGRNPTSPSLRYVGTTPCRKAERTIDA